MVAKRLVTILAAVLITTTVFAGGSKERGGTGSGSAGGGGVEQQSSGSGSAAAESATAFPVSIEHKFGTTEIPAQPERVVTIGYSEQDPVLALGVKPVAVRYWFGDHEHSVWPWAQDELGDAEPQVLRMAYGELNFETIAGLEPDLIVGTHSGITEEEYGTLSQIAPTLAQPGEYPNFGVPWQVQTRLIGRALGREEQAEQAIEDVESMIEQTREEHAAFRGATIAMASPAEGEGQYWTFSPNTPPMRFLTSLGFQVPDDIAELIGDRDAAQMSGEQLQMLDVDVLIWQIGSEEMRGSLQDDRLYQQLDVAQEGRAIYFIGQDDPIYGALSFSTVLSLPYALEHLEPMLEAAVDGDPATEVERP